MRVKHSLRSIGLIVAVAMAIPMATLRPPNEGKDTVIKIESTAKPETQFNDDELWGKAIFDSDGVGDKAREDKAARNVVEYPLQESVLREDLERYLRSIGKGMDELDFSNNSTIQLLSKLCLDHFPAACVNALFGRRNRYQLLMSAIELMPEGPKRKHREEQAKAYNDKTAVIADVGCRSGSSVDCSFALGAADENAAVLLPMMKDYCANGLKGYCSEIGEELSHQITTSDGLSVPVSEEKISEAKDYLSMGCDNDNGMSCVRLMKGRLSDDHDDRTLAAFDRYEKKCEEDSEFHSFPPPCATLARIYIDKGDFETSKTLADRACANGNSDGCLQLAEVLLKNGADRSQVLPQLERFCSSPRTAMSLSADDQSSCDDLLSSHVANDQLWNRLMAIRVFERTSTGLYEPLSERIKTREPASTGN